MYLERFLATFRRPLLDRRTGTRWIAAAGFAALVGVIAACSTADESDSSTAAAVAEDGRWELPSDVRSAGAKVHLAYDDAPPWTSTQTCAGKLRPGSRVLGEYLTDHYPVVSSVGGYACRQNTAALDRMSVHGTGRALDVMIPTVHGSANNGQGDAIANWLVKNAQSVGVQLVIWDRTIWRANGKNDAPYDGPAAHADHIHVELTSEAAAETTQWFADKSDGGAESATRVDAGNKDAAAGDPTPDPTPDPEPDPTPDPTPTPDPVPARAPDAATPAKGGTPPAGDPSSGLQSAADAPGAPDSLPDRPGKPKRTTATDLAPPTEDAGCSAAAGSRDSTRTPGAGVALMLGLGAWLRRRRR